MHEGFETILTNDALEFLGQLHRKFNRTRKDLMSARDTLQRKIDAGEPIKVNSISVTQVSAYGQSSESPCLVYSWLDVRI